MEGHPSIKILDYMDTYLNNRITTMNPKSNQILKDLQKKIRQAKELTYLDTFVTRMQNAIDDCKKNNSSFLVPGGWSGFPSGHTMYYEIIPEMNRSSCTFRLYNLGAGSQHHLKANLKLGAFIDWKGIETAHLKDPHFLLALKELRQHTTYPGEEILTKYDAGDVYEGLKNLLKPTHIEWKESNQPLPNMMKRQEIGICAWKSLAAVFSSHLPPKDYKLMMCDLKLQSVCQLPFLQAHLSPLWAQTLKKSIQSQPIILRSK